VIEADLQAFVDDLNEPPPLFLKSEFLERIDAPYRAPRRD
jgi:hypothetical protein